MSDQLQPEKPQEDSQQQSLSESFYSGALRRIRIFMAAIAPVMALGAAWKFGFRSAAGFAFGCAIAFVNFFWLKRAIGGFVDRASGIASSQSGEGVVARFLLRYLLMAVGAYVILTVSPASLNGLLAGLFLPVAAILCEAAYEVYAALVRGI